MKFYKHDPRAWLDGVKGLTLEERGAYASLCDRMYLLEGPLEDDASDIAGFLKVDKRVWKRLRGALIMKGKLVDTRDGYLTNRRVEKELQVYHELLTRAVNSGATGGKISAQRRAEAKKINEETEGVAQGCGQGSVQQKRKKRVSSLHSETLIADPSLRSGSAPPQAEEDVVVSLRPPLPVNEAVAAYNRTAEANGWARCRDITAPRRAVISARLRKYGLEGWNAVLTIASRADWVNDPDKRDPTHKSWKASIDWFAKEKTFVQQMESVDTNVLAEIETPEVWGKRLEFYDIKGVWFERKWGPAPGQPECRVPSALLPQIIADRPA